MERINIAELEDSQLDELLAYTPNFTEQNTENIKAMFLQKASKPSVKPVKRTVGRRVLLAAAVAALALATSITALAASGVIDIAGFYNRFYNSIFSNPEASPYVITGNGDAAVDGAATDSTTGNASGADGISDNTESPSASGFEIIGSGVNAPGSSGVLTVEPVAVFLTGDWDTYFFDVYVRLKLTAEDKLQLPDELFIHQKYTNEYGTHDVGLNSYGFTEVSYIDERSAFVSFRTHAFADNIDFDADAKTIAFNIHAFSSEYYLYSYPEHGIEEGGALIPVNDEYPITDGITYYGDWKVTIDTNKAQAPETIYVDGTFDGHDAIISIRPTSINMRVESRFPVSASGNLEYKYEHGGKFRVTLADGRVAESPYVEDSIGYGADMPSGTGEDGQTWQEAGLEIWGNVGFIIPEDVVKIELFGETVFSRD